MNIVSTYTWCQFAPAFALVGLAALLILADALLPKLPKRIYAFIAAMGTFVAAYFLSNGEHADSFGCIASIATGLSILLAFDYTKVCCESIAGGDNEDGTGEFYALPLVACAGILCLTQARDLVMLFVSLEVITLTSYVMAGYFRRNQGSIEAGIKYLVLGAMSTGILVYGTAWYFGMIGSFNLGPETVIAALKGGVAGSPSLAIGFMMSIALLFAGAFFKIGAAPMHVWIPDVYQGAPTPTTAFLAVASKTAGFVVLCALALPFTQFAVPGSLIGKVLVTTFAIVAAATLLIGNLGAMRQTNVKRLLGYSSIGQAGFILIFFLQLQGPVTFFVCKYLLAYALATIAAFYAVAMVRTQRGSEEIAAFRGLGKTNPRTAFLITVCFASLAGVPLTMGFMVKLYSFVTVISVIQNWDAFCWLLPIMVVTAAAGFYYYFKVLRAMYWEKSQPGVPALQVPLCTSIVLALCAIALIYMGTMPLLTLG
ncbi:MAG: NADH-quinone oxidoreductase subunit N [Akkermansia sp.]|nr:NADH-quinone oxidoreductase subunit N [Akkermansia sp.]